MRLLITLTTAVAVLAGLAMVPARGQEYTAGKIKITQVWVPQPPAGSQVAGGFMTIRNEGDQADTLTGGSAVVAGRLEIHEMAVEGGVMKMRELKPGLVIKPGETVALKPGSYHVMMMDLKDRPAVGNTVKGTLVFEKSGTVDVEYKVEPAGTRVPGQAATSGSAGGHDHHKGHK